MSTPPETVGRLKSFRLADLPAPILERGKSIAIKREPDPFKRFEIGRAAEHPSGRVYWVPTEAWERVMHPKARRRP